MFHFNEIDFGRFRSELGTQVTVIKKNGNFPLNVSAVCVIDLIGVISDTFSGDSSLVFRPSTSFGINTFRFTGGSDRILFDTSYTFAAS